MPKDIPNNSEVLKKMIVLHTGPSKIRDFGKVIPHVLILHECFFSHIGLSFHILESVTI